MRSSFVLAALIAVCSACPSPSASAAAVPAKPNLILVMTDDQAVRDLLAMPETLRLIANQGVTFQNSFVSWPLCCPSRTTTVTGEYAHNHRVLGNYAPKGGAQAFMSDAETLPVWLQRAGYSTTHIGKYLNGYGADRRGSTYIPPGWTDWMGLVDPGTYGMWGYTVNRNGVTTKYGDFQVEDPALYQTDVLRSLALDAIDRHVAEAKPFYLSVAFLAPHEEVSETPPAGSRYPGPRPAPRHAGYFANVLLPRPPSFDEVDLSDKARIVAAFGGMYANETLQQRTSRYRRRLQSLRAVDEAIQAIVAKLDALGVLQSTYIVFTSDNGWFNGEHRINLNKFLMYEPSIRVPLLVRGPGIAPGARSEELVANIDLAPTFVELAGATAGRVVDGRSLMPYARNPVLRSGRPILLDAPAEQLMFNTRASPSPVIVPSMRGLRTTRFSYVEYATGEVELYDLQTDPDQLKSLHNQLPAIRAALRAATAQYAGCVGQTCRAEMPH